MKLLKQGAGRLWPLLIGCGIFIFQRIWQTVSRDGSITTAFSEIKTSVPGPINGILYDLSIPVYSVITLLACCLLFVYCIWPKWYTAIISVVGAYAWLYIGMGLAGAGLWQETSLRELSGIHRTQLLEWILTHSDLIDRTVVSVVRWPC